MRRCNDGSGNGCGCGGSNAVGGDGDEYVYGSCNVSGASDDYDGYGVSRSGSINAVGVRTGDIVILSIVMLVVAAAVMAVMEVVVVVVPEVVGVR